MIVKRKDALRGLHGAVLLLFLGGGSCSALAATDGEANEFLDLDLTQLMNVTVTSVSKREQRLSEAAAAVYVISQEDIHRSGVTTIADALAMAPGLEVTKISASKWSVSSRGFPGLMSFKLLVLIDGRSIYSPLYSGVFWDQNNVMLEDIDRIEVIRGPGGTLWGANAVNGVINIITKGAENTQGGLVRFGLGNQEPFSAAGRYGGKISETTFARFYAMYEQHGSNRLASNGEDADDDWQPMQTGFRLDGKPGTGKEWTLQGDLYRNTGDQIISPYWVSSSIFPETRYDKIDTSGGNLLGRWQQTLSADSSITLQAYIDNSERDELLYDWQHQTLDFDLQYQTALGTRQQLTLGAGYRNVHIEVQSNDQIRLPDRTDDLYSTFIQDEINLVEETLWLTLGSKYEYNNYTGDEWQPSARLLWKAADNHSFWTSVARAVVTPTMAEQSARIVVGKDPRFPFPSEVTFTGQSSNGSEELWAYELGYRWQANQRLSLDLALFYNDYDNLFTVDQSTYPEMTFVNGVAGTGRGFEVASNWKAAAWLDFNLSYSYLDMRFKPKSGYSMEVLSSRYNDGSPQQQVSLRSSISLGKEWRLNLWGRYTDRITALDISQWSEVVIDGYFSVDANLIWTPNEHLEIMISGQNLTDSGQLQYISEYSTPPTEIESGVFGKMTWHF